MTELKRWTEEGAPEAIERLLEAAESEQPSAASLASALTSLGLAAAVTSVTSGAAGSGAATSGAATSGAATSGAAGSTVLTGAASKLSGLALTASLAKWVVLGSVVGGAAVVAVHTATEDAPPPTVAPPAVVRPAPTTRPAGAAEAAPASRTPAAPSAGTGSTADLPAARPKAARSPAPRVAAPAAAPAVVPPAVPAIPAETLAQEIAGIDRARSLLAAGRYSATSAALDDYERRFPKHHFSPEVLYLRMEAASGAGRTQEARRLAQRLLASYPTSPQSEKAKQLLGQSN